jgi:hypothetical protein
MWEETMRSVALLPTILAASMFSVSAMTGLPNQRPTVELAQAQGTFPPNRPPVFHPPPGGDRPTHNGNRPTTGDPPARPEAPWLPPRTNGGSDNRLNPTGDPDVQRGIDQHRQQMGR